jgi:hypothetical protein
MMWLTTISDMDMPKSVKYSVNGHERWVTSDEDEAGDPSAGHWWLGIFATRKISSGQRFNPAE